MRLRIILPLSILILATACESQNKKLIEIESELVQDQGSAQISVYNDDYMDHGKKKNYTYIDIIKDNEVKATINTYRYLDKVTDMDCFDFNDDGIKDIAVIGVSDSENMVLIYEATSEYQYEVFSGWNSVGAAINESLDDDFSMVTLKNILSKGASYSTEINAERAERATIKDLMNNPDFDVESTEEIRKDTIAEIMNKSYNVTCKKCGKEVYSCSTEIIKLPENYTEGAPKINEYMQKELDGLQSYSVDLECDFHPHDYSGMCFDNDVIDSINVINDKFLTVDVSSCCAIGGASRAYANNQLIFDLTTGEKLSFKDFFKGSDDDFKKIVKEKYGDESSMEIAEWIVSDGDSHIAYRDDAVVLFATKFDLTGASDSNLVEYEFTYQEMFGTDTLTR